MGAAAQFLRWYSLAKVFCPGWQQERRLGIASQCSAGRDCLYNQGALPDATAGRACLRAACPASKRKGRRSEESASAGY